MTASAPSVAPEALRETLRWFEEVDGGVYDWSTDEGAQAVIAGLRAALARSAPETKESNRE